MTGRNDITRLLERWNDGDEEALAELTPVVYEGLRRLAANALRSEKPGHTLQATALVHEAYLQIVNASVNWEGRHHFYALAARMMRRLLVNHAEAKSAAKRGGGAIALTLDESVVGGKEQHEDLLDLDRGLSELAAIDRRKADILECHYFAGMTYRETGAALGVSEATTKRELRFAKAWMRSYLDDLKSHD